MDRGTGRQLSPQMDADELLMVMVEGGSQVENGAPARHLPLLSPQLHLSTSALHFLPPQSTGNYSLNSESRARLTAVLKDLFLLKFSQKNFFD